MDEEKVTGELEWEQDDIATIVMRAMERQHSGLITEE